MVEINVVSSTYIVMIQNARTHIFYETIEFYLVPIDHVFFLFDKKEKIDQSAPKSVCSHVHYIHCTLVSYAYIIHSVRSGGSWA